MTNPDKNDLIEFTEVAVLAHFLGGLGTFLGLLYFLGLGIGMVAVGVVMLLGAFGIL